MKILALVLLAFAGAAIAGDARASAELAASRNCMGCHALDKKLVGPAFRDVAAKNKGIKGADARLAANILKGSSGQWGPMAMPPNGVSDAEALSLAKWVLSQK